MVRLRLSSPNDHVVMGFKGLGIFRYLNTIELCANKSLLLWNWDDFLRVANNRFVKFKFKFEVFHVLITWY